MQVRVKGIRCLPPNIRDLLTELEYSYSNSTSIFEDTKCICCDQKYMHSACPLHTQSMSPTYIVHVPNIHSACPQYTQCMSPTYMVHVPNIHSTCPLHAQSMSPTCIEHVPSMHSACPQHALHKHCRPRIPYTFQSQTVFAAILNIIYIPHMSGLQLCAYITNSVTT